MPVPLKGNFKCAGGTKGSGEKNDAVLRAKDLKSSCVLTWGAG
jgi:hypothetical protein